MRIQSKKECWMPNPETTWSAGEIKTVSNAVGKKLLINSNFSKVSDTKPEAKQRITKSYE